MKIGDIISFGKYNWIVLDVQKDKALLITEHIIEQRSFHDTYVETTWADCGLRDYLNSEFYHSFDEKDRERICSTINQNLDNQWYGTSGGVDTEDKIFLLSMDEIVCKYFGDSSSKLYNPGKNQRYWFERKDQNNSRRIARLQSNQKQICWWWTRSPGRVGVKAVYIHGDGNIGIQGNNILIGNLADGCCTGGVRPALWIRV